MAKVRAPDFDERLSNIEGNVLGHAYRAAHESLNTMGSSPALNGFLGAPLRYQLRSLEAKSKLLLGVDTDEIRTTLRDENKNGWQKASGVLGTVMRGIDHTSTASFMFSGLKYGVAAGVAGAVAACSAGPAAVVAAGAATAYCLKHYLGSDAGEKLEHGVGHALNNGHHFILSKFNAAKESSSHPKANMHHNIGHAHGHGVGHRSYKQTLKDDLQGLGRAIIAPHKAINHAYVHGGYALEKVVVGFMPVVDNAYLKATSVMDHAANKVGDVASKVLGKAAEAVQPVGDFINQKASTIMSLFVDNGQHYGEDLQPIAIPVVNERSRFKQRSMI